MPSIKHSTMSIINHMYKMHPHAWNATSLPSISIQLGTIYLPCCSTTSLEQQSGTDHVLSIHSLLRRCWQVALSAIAGKRGLALILLQHCTHHTGAGRFAVMQPFPSARAQQSASAFMLCSSRRVHAYAAAWLEVHTHLSQAHHASKVDHSL